MTEQTTTQGSAEPTTWDTPRLTEYGIDIGWDLRHGQDLLTEVHGEPVHTSPGVVIYATTNFTDHREFAERLGDQAGVTVEMRMLYMAMEDSASKYMGQQNWHNARPLVLINGDMLNV